MFPSASLGITATASSGVCFFSHGHEWISPYVTAMTRYIETPTTHPPFDDVSGEDMRHPTEDGVVGRNTYLAPAPEDPAALRVRPPATEDTADTWPGGYEHPRSYITVHNHTYSSHVGSHVSTCANFGIDDCKCCEVWPAVMSKANASARVGSVGASFSEARASKCNGDAIGAKASKLGSEGSGNRKGAIATSMRLEAKRDRRMLRLEKASVGTEDNNHTDDLNMLFVHLSREFPDVTLKSCEVSEIDIQTTNFKYSVLFSVATIFAIRALFVLPGKNITFLVRSNI